MSKFRKNLGDLPGVTEAARFLAIANKQQLGRCNSHLKLFDVMQLSIELWLIVVIYLLKVLSSGSLGSWVDEKCRKLRLGI